MANMQNQPLKPKSKAQRCHIDLAMPPHDDQVKHAGGRSKIYEQWLEVAREELQSQTPITITGPVALRIRAGLTEVPRDIDRIGRGLSEFLVAHGVIENVVNVVDLTMRWDRIVQSGRCAVELWRTSPPHQRITGESRQRVSEAQKRRWATIRARRAADPANAAA